MAPRTPTSASKTPKAAAAGGPVPFTGIPAPASVLQRRSFAAASPSVATKSYQNMTPEQQSLLAEAISIHNPGLIDPNRKRTDSVSSDSTSASSSYQHYHQSPAPTAFSQGATSNINGGTASPSGALAPPLSYRSSQTQARRTSTSRTSASPESSNIRVANGAYSAIPPLTTASFQQSFASNTSSPTTATAESPSGLRSVRLSQGPVSSSGAAAAASPNATGSRLSKQPLFQRPPSAGSSSALGPRTSMMAFQNNSNSTHASTSILGSPIQNQPQTQPHGQNQFPASLEGIELGDRVVVESMGLSGYLRFVGTAEFKTGVWAGIELDTPTGKNDGSVNGVVYFNCRPKCGIFVLAAKIVKTELLIPFSSVPEVTARPPSAQEDNHTTPPPVNHAAQAASRITAGSRASKYIGVTATQLKQRNIMPQSTNSRLPAQQQLPGPTADHSPGSPTTARTISHTTQSTGATTTARTNLGSRLSQSGSKASLLSQANRAAATNNRTHSTTSPTAGLGSRPRTSPTPGRLLTSPRRVSSRASDHSDTNNSTSSVLSSSLLDQATLVQMAESPHGSLATQYQQLQLDYGVAVAENNMLKTEMNQTKSQLEMTRLLEKRDLSYDERAFLSKSLGRGGIDERLGQELEDLHAMKTEWEKEKSLKDQEIKGITEKMTQAWLDAARSQKEKTALLQEKTELEEKLKGLEESGVSGLESGPASEEQQTMIDSLKKDLQEAEERSAALESTIQEFNNRALEDEDRIMSMEEILAANQSHYAERLVLLEQERDDLQMRLDDLELVMKVTTEALQSKLEAAIRDAGHSEEVLLEVQARLEHESELRRTKESEAETKLKAVETELRESQTLLNKSEKLCKTFEEKAKDYESSVAKREQEIAGLKLELEDLTGMVQSEEVDRMRKVWENEKKRLEEAVADDITVITTLRDEIQSLEANETELQAKIEDLEATIATLKASNSELEYEVSQLKTLSAAAQEQFDKERSELQGMVTEAEKSMELRAAETKDKIEDLEAIALTVETWKEQCEAMQFEIVQKTAKAQDIELELADAQAEREASKQEAETAQKELADKVTQLADMENIRQELKTIQDDKSQLLAKVSELEAALALSASAPTKTSSVPEADESKSSAKTSELEEEIAHLKQMVHDLTRENVTIASVNKKLMQEHDNLMEAHKHVETECLKLMDEVERLHAESLAAPSLDGIAQTQTGAGEKDSADLMENAEPTITTPGKESITEHQAPASQSHSVIRLEGLLKEKQALLDRLTQAHASEMRELRQRYVALDRSKAYEVAQLNKELTELESLIESKIFHEADLEEECQLKQKQIDQLQLEIVDLKKQLSHSTNGSNGSSYMHPSTRSAASHHSDLRAAPVSAPAANPIRTKDESQALFCEICEVEGHDIISCTAVFGANNSRNKVPVSAPSLGSITVPTEVEEERPYCENCEEFGTHYTDECPNESLTY